MIAVCLLNLNAFLIIGHVKTFLVLNVHEPRVHQRNLVPDPVTRGIEVPQMPGNPVDYDAGRFCGLRKD